MRQTFACMCSTVQRSTTVQSPVLAYNTHIIPLTVYSCSFQCHLSLLQTRKVFFSMKGRHICPSFVLASGALLVDCVRCSNITTAIEAILYCQDSPTHLHFTLVEPPFSGPSRVTCDAIALSQASCLAW